ncbi:contactin-2-like [Periophthalmus magnuspinnatus]|uniref:contactin-2-like n=1 Tax=Periophthalmus magnuspinnatus TaxID=409849 RepID=UPI002436714D|nr:contactin-2-like [Periophthalmus magnuspinnatus]
MKSKLFIFVFLYLLKDVKSESVEVFAEVGSRAVLPCRSTPQTVSPAITWSNSKGSIWRMLGSGVRFWSSSWASRVRCPHTHFHLGDYSLEILGVRQEDGGSYFCLLELGQRRTLQVTEVTLRVVKVSISPAVPVIGQSVSIRCDVSGGEGPSEGEGPRGPTVRWMLNGRPYGSRRIRGVQNNELKVTASEKVTGNWTCLLNDGNADGRASGRLGVEGIIRPPGDGARVFAAVGVAVSLPCVFAEGLAPSDAFWERLPTESASERAAVKLPRAFSPPPSSVSSRDKSAALREVEFEDAGRYRCSASVQGQKTQRSLELVTVKVDVEVLSEDAVKLTCRLSDPSAVREYEWINATFDLDGMESTGSGQKGQSVNVSRTSGGRWTCRFYGKQGLLGNVTHDIYSMEGHRGATPAPVSRRMSHNAVLLLVGLFVVALVLLLVLIQMYRNQLRSKKAFRFLALETVLHAGSVERELKERSPVPK